MKSEITHFILRFDDTSAYPQQFVALDTRSGGYPTPVEDPTKAKFWESEEKACEYAHSFLPGSKSYASYVIEQKVYILRSTVEESTLRTWCEGTKYGASKHIDCPDGYNSHTGHSFEVKV